MKELDLLILEYAKCHEAFELGPLERTDALSAEERDVEHGVHAITQGRVHGARHTDENARHDTAAGATNPADSRTSRDST